MAAAGQLGDQPARKPILDLHLAGFVDPEARRFDRRLGAEPASPTTPWITSTTDGTIQAPPAAPSASRGTRRPSISRQTIVEALADDERGVRGASEPGKPRRARAMRRWLL